MKQCKRYGLIFINTLTKSFTTEFPIYQIMDQINILEQLYSNGINKPQNYFDDLKKTFFQSLNCLYFHLILIIKQLRPS